MTTIISGTSGLTFPDNSTQAVGFYGFKNRIINGAMVIDQRNAGASVSNAASRVYTLDRWASLGSASSKFTIQQTPSATETGYATRVGAGFTNYLAITSSAATSVAAGDYYLMQQFIEGLNVADLAWGTSSAKTITLSFWVYSSLTGTFGGALQNSAQDRSYPFSYTINSASTWEQKSITIAGDQSGTWLTTSGKGISLIFGLGIGSTFSGTSGAWAAANYFAPTGATSVVGTNGATFYITGVQLEKGSTATSFDYRPYGTELALCQRYYQGINSATNFSVMGVSSGSNIYTVFLIVPLRASPSFSGNINIQQYYFNSAGGAQLNQAVAYASLSFGGGVNQFRMVTPGAGASGLATWFDVNSGSLQISAEL